MGQHVDHAAQLVTFGPARSARRKMTRDLVGLGTVERAEHVLIEQVEFRVSVHGAIDSK
jgi:hypothetical protein